MWEGYEPNDLRSGRTVTDRFDGLRVGPCDACPQRDAVNYIWFTAER